MIEYRQEKKNYIGSEWLIYGGLIFIALFGLWFLRYTIVHDGQRSKANSIVAEKVKIAEAHIETKHYDAAISILKEAYSIEFATNSNIVDACMRKIEQQKELILMSKFKVWVDFRKYNDTSTISIYDSYFSSFLATLRIESITPEHLKELAEVERLIAVLGFNMFLKHFEIALLKVYNVSNYKMDHESELRAEMKLRKNDIMEDVVNNVLAKLPKR